MSETCDLALAVEWLPVSLVLLKNASFDAETMFEMFLLFNILIYLSNNMMNEILNLLLGFRIILDDLDLNVAY